jgi:hypothetical protein
LTNPIDDHPSDIAWGFLGGVVCGASTPSRGPGWPLIQPVAEVLGIEAVLNQSSLSRFFGVLIQRTAIDLGCLHF